MKTKLIVSFVIVAVIIIAAAFYINTRPITQKTSQPITQITPSITPVVTPSLTPTTAPANTIEYVNNEYNFKITLPITWQGYSVVTDIWKGYIPENQGQKLVEQGPLISLRHPLWTKAKPRQDIPIMVFTTTQWSDLQQEMFHIGAAPIGPSELGGNTKYVFAIPARYNFAFLPGFEEVETILQAKTFHTF